MTCIKLNYVTELDNGHRIQFTQCFILIKCFTPPTLPYSHTALYPHSIPSTLHFFISILVGQHGPMPGGVPTSMSALPGQQQPAPNISMGNMPPGGPGMPPNHPGMPTQGMPPMTQQQWAMQQQMQAQAMRNMRPKVPMASQGMPPQGSMSHPSQGMQSPMNGMGSPHPPHPTPTVPNTTGLCAVTDKG